MTDRLIAILLALGMVMVTVPASANHLSVGGEDSVGTRTTADETPSDPSVEGDTVGNEKEPYGLGTSTDCQDGNASKLSAEEAGKAATSRSFCGDLVYHQGDSDLRQTSPPDQHIPDPSVIGSFDVVRAGYAGGASLSYCYVFCGFLVGGDTTYEVVHTVGEAAGLTHGPEKAKKKGGDRYQTTSYAVTYPAASSIVEANADTWRMNGWANPKALETFAGFLTDPDGDPIDEQRLQEIFDNQRSRLPSDGTTSPDVCGFSPDHSLSISAADQGICEADFSYVSDGDDLRDGGDFKDGYSNEPCKSPTYVCGAANEYWQATLVCLAGNSIVLNEQNPCTDNRGPTDPTYTRFHWVVAPTESLCNGQQEPGFKTSPDAELPYLAHELDVWVPPSSVNGVQSTQGVANTEDYVVEAQNEQTPENTDARERGAAIFDRIFDTVLPATPVTAPDLVDTAQTSTVDKPNRVEPNAKGTHGTGLVEDSQIESASAPSKQGGTCAPLLSGDEFRDPWKNIVDTSTIHKGTYGTTSAVEIAGLYANQDPNQDSVNDPGPTPFFTEGKVGMFRDANDDGDYDQAESENLFANIQSAGAYPLFWDMRVDNQGNIDQDSGCSFGFGETKLSEGMENAGYGPRTGLVQAIYLKEPSAVISDTEVRPQPAGNTIYLFESQAIHKLRTDLSGYSVVEDFVSDIVDGLRDQVQIPEDASVVNVNEIAGTDSAFAPQCQEDTGGFTTSVSLVHACQAGCAGDTIATGYLAELTSGDEIGSHSGNIPFFKPDGKTTYTFTSTEGSFLKWTDVDPFDGNPDRNDDSNDRPRHHSDGENPGDRHHQ